MVKLKGGKIPVDQLKKFIDASPKYPHVHKIDDFLLDTGLSNKYVQVYYNLKTHKAIVCHRQTTDLKDVLVDIGLALGIKKGPRFNISQETQMEAEQKYGPSNISTIGYSLGGLLAEEYGKNTHEIITYNKAAIPSGNNTHENQYDIRTQNDLVSFLTKFQKGKQKQITIESNSYNPIKEHETSNLDKLPSKLEIGHGRPSKMTIKQLKEAIKMLRKKKKVKGVRITGLKKSELISLYSKLIN